MAGMSSMEGDAAVRKNAAIVKKLVEVCPVNIFEQEKDGALRVVEANLDEWHARDLCIQRAGPRGDREAYENGA